MHPLRQISLAAVVSMVTVPAAMAVTFTDVHEGDWFFASVDKAAALGIVSGYEDEQGNATGLFGPGRDVTIVEAVKMVGAGEKLEQLMGGEANVPWQLVPEEYKNHWAAKEIAMALAFGKLAYIGEIGEFDINRPATRQEVAQIIAVGFVGLSGGDNPTTVPFYGLYKDVKKENPYRAQIEAMTREGILTGDKDAAGNPTGMFRPYDRINRAETVKMLMRAIEVQEQLHQEFMDRQG